MESSISSLRGTIRPPFDVQTTIERGELAVAYQPILDLRDGSVFAVEALTRWMHPQYGMLPPAAFLPQIHTPEDHRIFDLWVLHRASTDMLSLPRRSRSPVALTINVGAKHLGGPDSIAELASALTSSDLDPSRIIIELTESDALRDTAEAVTTINRLKRLGVRFAIDDFGTGCATLDYLARLPADFLKIDRSFMARCHQEKPAAIIEAILMLTQRFGIDAIVEGIESREQLRFVCARRAPYAQGYLFSRPMFLPQLRDLLKTPPGHWRPVR